MNIDDIKLQLYVDGELDTKDISEVEKFIQDNPSAKKKLMNIGRLIIYYLKNTNLLSRKIFLKEL